MIATLSPPPSAATTGTGAGACTGSDARKPASSPTVGYSNISAGGTRRDSSDSSSEHRMIRRLESMPSDANGTVSLISAGGRLSICAMRFRIDSAIFCVDTFSSSCRVTAKLSRGEHRRGARAL